jgi:hypothetical protein
VVVQTNVHPRHLTAVVLPLLLPELPVFTWWEGTPPFGEEVFDELTSVTDRLIVDSAAFVDPVADLRRLAGVVGALEPAVTDCAWGRLTPWRELLAAPFSGPQLRPALDRVEAPPGHLVATVEVPGQPTGRRKVGRSAGPSTGPASLGAELQLFGRDRVFEDALAEAAALVPA